MSIGSAQCHAHETIMVIPSSTERNIEPLQSTTESQKEFLTEKPTVITNCQPELTRVCLREKVDQDFFAVIRNVEPSFVR